MRKRDGGQAFPTMKRIRPDSLPVRGAPTDYVPEYIGGMSLRDYFAAQALAGYLASPSYGEEAAMNPDKAARWAYENADAMLTTRARTEETETDE